MFYKKKKILSLYPQVLYYLGEGWNELGDVDGAGWRWVHGLVLTIFKAIISGC